MAFALANKRRRLNTVPLGAFNAASDDDQSDAEKHQGLVSDISAVQAAGVLKDKGQDLAVRGEYSAALRAWDQAVLLTPYDAVLHELRAQVLSEVGQAWQAVQAASRATQLEPVSTDALLTLARAQLNYGESQLAVRSFEHLLQLQPSHAEAVAELQAARAIAVMQQRVSSGCRLRVIEPAPAATTTHAAAQLAVQPAQDSH